MISNRRLLMKEKLAHTFKQHTSVGSAIEENSLSDLEYLPFINHVITHQGLDPKKNIDSIVQSTWEWIGGTCALYNRLDEKEGLLHVYSSYNIPQGFKRTDSPDGHICYEETIKGKNRLIAISDLENSRYFKTDAYVIKYGLKSYLGFPVSYNRTVKGALCIADTRKREFSPIERRVIKAFATALSFEEERIQFYRILEKRLNYDRMAADISSLGLSVKDIQAFLHQCIHTMGEALDVGGVFFWKYNPCSETFSCVTEWLQKGMHSQMDLLQDIPADQLSLASDLFHRGQAFKHHDIRKVPEGREKEIMEMLNIKSVLVFPVSVGNMPYGFLGLEDYAQHRTWSRDDIRILKTVSHIIMHVIEARLAEKEIIIHRDHLEEEVNKRTAKLEQQNTALNILLEKMKKVKIKTEEKVLFNIKETVAPYLKRLKNSRLDTDQRACLGMIESNLEDIASPLGYRLSSPHMKLTPTEIRVANLIKHGKTTKEISHMLCLSDRTVERHRYNIRKKLAIHDGRVSLRTFLLRIE
jgi:GAF domain-containing protein/DNA-binding CsgD family transcriptional regulator